MGACLGVAVVAGCEPGGTPAEEDQRTFGRETNERGSRVSGDATAEEHQRMFGWETNERGSTVHAPSKAIQCGRLLDVTNRTVRENVTILLDADRIVAVEEGLLAPEDADAVIDLGDLVCSPGLMDMHLHLTASFYRIGETHRPQDPFHYTVAETAVGLDHAREVLYTGVTTIRSPSEYLPDDGHLWMRDAIRQGLHVGPRIFASDISIGYDYAREIVVGAGERHYELRKRNNITYNLTTPGESDVRQAVRDSLDRGEEWVKVSVDIGGDLSDMEHHQLWSLEELTAMADETHMLGKKITGHIEMDGSIRDAVTAGFDSIEHGYIPSRETADLMKERNIYWSTTLADLQFGYDRNDPLIGADNPVPVRDLTEQIKRRDEAFKYAYEIGVPMVYASDGWFNPSQNRSRLALEFSNYLHLGVTPWDMLTFATLNPAEMLGESENLGSIDPGKYADIVAFPDNPLEDVVLYNKVKFVMKGGEVFRDDLNRNPLPDVFAMEFADVTYINQGGEIVCIGSDCE